jgi:hypothetical protein
MQIASRLQSLYSKQKLAHFYVLQMQGADQQSQLAEELAKAFTGQEPASALQHPDILVLKPEGKNYLGQQDDFTEYMRSWEFRPTNLSYRFFIFTDAHLLSDNILNKMLKQLEEPPAWSCILFLNPSGKKLLQTIESRSVRFQLPPNQAPEWDASQGNFAKWLEFYLEFFNSQNKVIEDPELLNEFKDNFLSAIKGNPWSYFEDLSKNPRLEDLINQLTAHLSLYKHTKFLQVQHALEEIQACAESKAFYNNGQLRAERLLRVWQRTLGA